MTRETVAVVVVTFDRADLLAGMLTGLAALDFYIGGFEPEELIVVGARPSRGKSALGLTLAANASEQGQHRSRVLVARTIADAIRAPLRKTR